MQNQIYEGKPFEVLDGIPGATPGAKGKWRQVFDNLEFGQVVRFECKDLGEADRLRRSAVGNIRQVKSVPYLLKTQRRKESGKVVLYIEKIKRGEN